MKTNVVAMILIIAVRQLRKMSVQYNIPQQVIIHSNYLDLGKTVGQGNINIIFKNSWLSQYCYSKGEFGIVYKSRLKRSQHDTISDIVAVKTLKGRLCIAKCK